MENIKYIVGIMLIVLSGKGTEGRYVTSCSVTAWGSSITINVSYQGSYHRLTDIYVYYPLRSYENLVSPCMNAISATHLSVISCHDYSSYLRIFYQNTQITNTNITLHNFNFPATPMTFPDDIKLRAYWGSSFGSYRYCLHSPPFL